MTASVCGSPSMISQPFSMGRKSEPRLFWSGRKQQKNSAMGLPTRRADRWPQLHSYNPLHKQKCSEALFQLRWTDFPSGASQQLWRLQAGEPPVLELNAKVSAPCGDC